MRLDLAELPLVLGCLRCGFVLGMVYDLLRLPRRGGGRIVTALTDAVFGACFFILCGITLFVFDSGRIRAWSLPLILLAFVVWQRLPGRLIRLCAASIRSAFRHKTRKSK